MCRVLSIIAALIYGLGAFGQNMDNCNNINPLRLPSGEIVNSSTQWYELRRPQLLELLKANNYGYIPDLSTIKTTYLVVATNQHALRGTATQKQIRVTFTRGEHSKSMNILLLVPNAVTKPAVFLGYNFHGNYTITTATDVPLTDKYVFHPVADKSIVAHASESFRGSAANDWAVSDMISRGYALATIHYADIYEDTEGGYENSIAPLIYHNTTISPQCGKQGLWAWGLIRAMDYLQNEPLINPKRVFVTGVSRLGKVALYAGAQDDRFAMVVPHCSGGVTKAEDAKQILLALVAPRPLYSTTSERDIYAVPQLEFNYLKEANRVYDLLGSEGLGSDTLPPINIPILEHNIGFHIKPGTHRIDRYDWEQAMNFADKHFGMPRLNLPNPLRYPNGRVVKTAKEWSEKRRPQIVSLLEQEQYGYIPKSVKFKTQYKLISTDTQAFNSLATRKEVEVVLSHAGDTCRFNLLLYTPNRGHGPSPIFLGVNFAGNYTVCNDPAVMMPNQAKYKNQKYSISAERRGSDSSSWNIEQTLQRGYGVATFFGGDIFEDMAGGAETGAATMAILYPKGRDSNSCGFIGSVAWALSRAMDYLEHDSDADPRRVAVIGCSRNGKIALWAGALDTRFAMVISSSSGSAGASLYRGNSTETIEMINRRFPYWMCDNFKRHNGAANQLPFDQHMLLALIAPRPLYVANSDRDRYVISRDEFTSVCEAGKVYEFLGCTSLQTTIHPMVNVSIMHTMGYHTKSGEHSITLYDWQQYWDFADLHFGRPQ